MMLAVPVAGEPSLDDALVRSAMRGDRSAFARLYERYARMVHGILLARVRPWEADDLTQDVFVQALERIGGLRTAEALPGWLAAIARHRATDHFRAARRWTPLEDAPPQRAAADGHREALLLLDLIRRLPPAYRETLVLRLVEGMTGPEIASQTGLTPDSVRVNLCRGMKLLRELAGGEEK